MNEIYKGMQAATNHSEFFCELLSVIEEIRNIELRDVRAEKQMWQRNTCKLDTVYNYGGANNVGHDLEAKYLSCLFLHVSTNPKVFYKCKCNTCTQFCRKYVKKKNGWKMKKILKGPYFFPHCSRFIRGRYCLKYKRPLTFTHDSLKSSLLLLTLKYIYLQHT